MKPPVALIHAPGTNRDRDVSMALELAGAAPKRMPLETITSSPNALDDYRMIVVPGGFSFGDSLGAGRALGQQLRTSLGDALWRHLEKKRPILGICNGFQALLAAGLLGSAPSGEQEASLVPNQSGHFECRWVRLTVCKTKSIFTEGIDEISCPVAHAEGRFWTTPRKLHALREDSLIALKYRTQGDPLRYPQNPNGSLDAIAGLTDTSGLILGLMPHPENHILASQTPLGLPIRPGLPLFQNGVKYAAQC